MLVSFCLIWLCLYSVQGALFVGPNNKFLCNCKNDQCQDSGGCKGSSSCIDGYFGYACQYRYVFDYKNVPVPELADWSINTCATRESIEIRFNQTKVRAVFLWVNETSNYQTLRYIFKEKNVNKTCGGSLVVAGPTIIEYHCSRPVRADGLIIHIFNKIAICHIAIGEGRNFAINSTVYASAAETNNFLAVGLTDGVTHFEHGTCYKAQSDNTAVLMLSFPIRLGILEIFDIPPDFNTLGNVEISITAGETSTKYRIQEKIGRQIKSLIFHDDLRNVNMISLNSSRKFGACEIKLIGDCDFGTHGLACSETCHGSCKWCNMYDICLDEGFKQDQVLSRTKHSSSGIKKDDSLIVSYVGPDKLFLCNCENNNCLDDGICEENVKCKEGYFGYACQYINAFDYKTSTIPELNDDSYDTCVRGRSSFQISFSLTRVRFLRLSVTETSKYKGLRITFRENQENRTCNSSIIVSSPKVIEYHCHVPVKADGLIIYNISEIHICHIEVSKGRNFAIKSKSITSDVVNSTFSGDGLNDGITALDNHTCYLTKNDFSFVILLKNDISLSIVELFDIPPDFNTLGRLTIEIVTKSGTSADFTIEESSGSQVKSLIPTEELYKVNMLRISSSMNIGACEILAYGDCEKGTYGLACSEPCPDDCKWCTLDALCLDEKHTIECSQHCGKDKSCNSTTGTCNHGCEPGFYRNDCSLNCSDSCGRDKSCSLDGNCTYGCEPGFFGLDCKFNCSSNCAVDRRCDLMGTCAFGCRPGFFEKNCSSNCSQNCADDKSCDINGTCRSGCLPGFYGYNCSSKCSDFCDVDKSCLLSGMCTFGCIAGFYGPYCNSTCNRHCGHSGACNQKGECSFGCEKGYYGTSCDLPCSPYCSGDRHCDFNGTCIFGCTPGFFGEKCQLQCYPGCAGDGSCNSYQVCVHGCRPGYYDTFCSKPCSSCNESCDMNGTCLWGCRPTFFGNTCTSLCSPYCANDGSCDDNGICTYGCEPGYFGPKCIQLGLSSNYNDNQTWNCHCQGGKCADRLDICSHLDKCIIGWFGFHCAYKDVGVTAQMSSRYLNDNDNETCYEPPKNTVSLEWRTPVWFTWAWLTFRNDSNVSHLSLVGENNLGTHYLLKKQLQIKKITSTIVEIRYIGLIKVSTLVIYWAGRGSVCSISVNGDHNIALAISKLPSLPNYRRIKNLILPVSDGVISGENCVDFQSQSYKELVYYFNPAVWISTISIYPDITQTVNGTLQFVFSPSPKSKKIKSDRLLVGKRVSVFAFYLPVLIESMEINVVNGSAHVCEMEIFGECSPPNYGFGCREMCPITCSRDRCDYRGQCLKCIRGRTGPHCMEYIDSENNNETTQSNKCSSRYCKNHGVKRLDRNVYLYFSLYVLVFWVNRFL